LRYISRFLASSLVSNSSKKNTIHGTNPFVDLVYPLLCSFNLFSKLVVIPT